MIQHDSTMHGYLCVWSTRSCFLAHLGHMSRHQVQGSGAWACDVTRPWMREARQAQCLENLIATLCQLNIALHCTVLR
jgi:hypothetical protein